MGARTSIAVESISNIEEYNEPLKGSYEPCAIAKVIISLRIVYSYEYMTARDIDSYLVCHSMLYQRYSAATDCRNLSGYTNDDLVQPTMLPELQI